MAAGGAVLLASVITGSLALSTSSKLDAKCPDKQCSSQADLDLRDRAKGLKIATDVLWSIGAVTAALGVFFVIRAAKSDERVSDVTISPEVADGQGGFVVEGRF